MKQTSHSRPVSRNSSKQRSDSYGRKEKTPRHRNLSDPKKKSLSIQDDSNWVQKALPLLSKSIAAVETKLLKNLHIYIKVEANLWGIYQVLYIQSISNPSRVTSISKEYWNLTEDGSIQLLEVRFYTVQKLYKDESNRKAIRQCMIVESVSIIFTAHTIPLQQSSHLEEIYKTLLYYIHQNFLKLIELALQKVAKKNAQNQWVVLLKELVQSKKAASTSKLFESLKQTTHSAIGILVGLSRNFRTAFVGTIVKHLERISYTRARLIVQGAIDMSAEHKYAKEAPSVLPPPKKDYTLVLDLDETLVHYIENEDEAKMLVRPGACEFLEEMGKYYEIVIFTAAVQDYADWAIDQIDPERCVSHRLYRQHATETGNIFVKDLGILGRDLNKTIIVDNVASNFQLQPENGILIKTWIDDPEDTALMQLAPLLINIVRKEVEDVRRGLRTYREQMVRQLALGVPVERIKLSLE